MKLGGTIENTNDTNTPRYLIGRFINFLSFKTSPSLVEFLGLTELPTLLDNPQ